MTEPSLENRRPLKSRSSNWAQAAARALARAGFSPNAISFGAVLFAAVGCAAFVAAGPRTDGLRVALLILAGLCVQARLICNLLDGMVAVEHGKGSPSGPIWNELPDRIADALFLVGAGYCAFASGQANAAALGWAAAVLAVLTAYIRELGRGLGLPADFQGPMAKPQRMAALTVGCVVSAAEPLWGWRGESLLIVLALIVAGAAWTSVKRTLTLAERLRNRP